jgi:Icc-related predicted phosphoesterase
MATLKRSDQLLLAAVGDLHCTKSSKGTLRTIFASASEAADVLALCGDLTDYGLPEEAEVLADELQAASRIPVLAVLGNHDHEADRADEVRAVLLRSGVWVLDGGTVEVHGVGFVGTKGFGGGFARGMLAPWGEKATKLFVQAAVDEAMKLEMALGRTRAQSRVALLHYAPIPGTLAGEQPEIFPFLGTGRLEEPLNRFSITAVCHGHAHYGTAEGQTQSGIPVYNVALPLLRREHPGGHAGYRLIEIPRQPPTADVETPR